MIPGNRYRFTNAGTNVSSRISALATRKFSWSPYSTSPERSCVAFVARRTSPQRRRSRFQVIAKLPFASLSDKRVKKRMEVEKSWYNLNGAQKFIQTCGRSIRSNSDYATTYILDGAFDGFYHRASQFFPEYILDAFRFPDMDVS
jgi:RAD3-like DEAD/DEAH box helicase